MNELELRRELRRLALEREPRHELWPGIQARLEPRRDARVRRWSMLALAASLGLVALLARPLLAPGEAGIVASDLPRVASAVHVEYRWAQAQLAAVALPNELRSVDVTLDASERALRAALRADPQSRYLLGQLRRTAEHRLRLRQLSWLS